MKILIKEEQYNIITESINNLDEFVDKIFEVFDLYNRFKKQNADKLKSLIKYSIQSSGCESIKFQKLDNKYGGLSLHDGVFINTEVLYGNPLSMVLYIIFHEIGHQYQFKKYGIDLMYKPYRTDRDFEEAIKIIREREMVADEYAIRKLREFIKFGFLPRGSTIGKGFYKLISIDKFKEVYTQIFNQLDDINDNDRISEIIYNTVLKGK